MKVIFIDIWSLHTNVRLDFMRLKHFDFIYLHLRARALTLCVKIDYET